MTGPQVGSTTGPAPSAGVDASVAARECRPTLARTARSAALIGCGLLLAGGLAGWPRGACADDGHAEGDRRRASQPSQPADAGLMEFLGGIGSESDEWIDYLARTDPTRVAAAPERPPPSDGRPPRRDPPGSQQK